MTRLTTTSTTIAPAAYVRVRAARSKGIDTDALSPLGLALRGIRPLEVTPQYAAGRLKAYKKCVGKKADGKPRIFWLGRDKARAHHLAKWYAIVWAKVQSEGRTYWTDADVRAAESLAAETERVVTDVFAQAARARDKLLPELAPRLPLDVVAPAAEVPGPDLRRLAS